MEITKETSKSDKRLEKGQSRQDRRTRISQNNEKYYKLIKIIGQGTFGRVYLAETITNCSKLLAIKYVLQNQRFKNRELEISKRLDHENIVPMLAHYFTYEKSQYDPLAVDCYLSLVMPYFKNSLYTYTEQRRRAKKPFTEIELKIITFQLFKALSYMKDLQLCHRDIKPHNILIDPETMEVRICDFGSAKFMMCGEENVAYICSRFYRAPELLLGYTRYSTEVDVWSMGCVFIQMIIYDPLFPGDSTLQQLIEIIKLLGTPTVQYLQSYSSNVHESIFKMPQLAPQKWSRVLKNYNPPSLLIDLVSKMLVYDSRERPTPGQALMHEFYSDLKDPKYSDYTNKLPNLFNFNNNLFINDPVRKERLLDLFTDRKEGQPLQSELPEKDMNPRDSPSSAVLTGASTPSSQL